MGLGGAWARFRYGDPFAAGADSAALLGRICGYALAPLILGALMAWILGWLRTARPGAFHRRTNWFALIALALGVAGSLTEVAR